MPGPVRARRLLAARAHRHPVRGTSDVADDRRPAASADAASRISDGRDALKVVQQVRRRDDRQIAVRDSRSRARSGTPGGQQVAGRASGSYEQQLSCAARPGLSLRPTWARCPARQRGTGLPAGSAARPCRARSRAQRPSGASRATRRSRRRSPALSCLNSGTSLGGSRALSGTPCLPGGQHRSALGALAQRGFSACFPADWTTRGLARRQARDDERGPVSSHHPAMTVRPADVAPSSGMPS